MSRILSLAVACLSCLSPVFAGKALPLVPKPAKLIVQDTRRVPAEGYRHPPLLRDARAEVYKTVGDTELLAFVFEPEGHKRADKRPAALFFYGGGWITYNPGQFAPPTIVFLGTEDELIPVATGRKYERLMKEAGSRCELNLFEGEGHGFFNRGDNYYKTSMLMDAFLNSLGYVKGDATLEAPADSTKEPNQEN